MFVLCLAVLITAIGLALALIIVFALFTFSSIRRRHRNHDKIAYKHDADIDETHRQQLLMSESGTEA